MNIYKKLIDAGVEIDNHESDLYAKVTPISKEIIDKYEHKRNVKTFVNNIDHTLWYDIPFAYEPFWHFK